jgi:hypothetical protein
LGDPEYLNDPSKEIYQSLEILKNKKVWKDRYQNFIDSMVYDKTAITDYDKATYVLEKISARVIRSLKDKVLFA